MMVDEEDAMADTDRLPQPDADPPPQRVFTAPPRPHRLRHYTSPPLPDAVESAEEPPPR